MRAMVFNKKGERLKLQDVPIPTPSETELLIRVTACGICRTDLHIIDGELTNPKLPLIPGHQIVGIVEELGSAVKGFNIGQRVGVPWLGSSFGHCFYCLNSQENLCDNAQYTGYQLNGGLAEYCIANSQFCFPVPDNYPDLQAAPSFPYEILWGERHICSVANLTRKDGEAFLKIAPQVPIKTQVNVYPLEKANEALEDLRMGRFSGAAVIQIGHA